MHKPDAWCHRVDSVLGFFFPVVRIGTPPHPLTHRRVCPLPLGSGGPHSLAGEGVRGVPFRTKGQTLLYKYM